MGGILNFLFAAPSVNCLTHFLPCTQIPRVCLSLIMACDSGCCAPKMAPTPTRTPTPPSLDVDAGGSIVTDEGDKPSKLELNTATDICCDSLAKDAPNVDGCCSSRPVQVEAENLKVPSCCEGKPSPCCDSTCIENLALRECISDSIYSP